MELIGIVDLGIGNLRSVYNAFYSQGFDVQVVNSGEAFDDLSRLVIPGVGSFKAAIDGVEKANLREPIRSFAASGRPVLGICLGMQILAERGDEHGPTRGLSLVGGSVSAFKEKDGFPLPHVGWNSLECRTYHPVFEKVKKCIDCYFVHSYRFICSNPDDVLAVSEYGEQFAAVVGAGNVVGFQFHPEKSQVNGLKMIANFCGWNGQC